jgi:hypothetical protein
MKIKNLIFRIYPSILILGILIFFQSCKKEPTPCELMEGSWKCMSWKADTLQLLGPLISYSILDFNKLENQEGAYKWVVKNVDGELQILDGIYNVTIDCSEVKLTPTTFPIGGNGYFEMNFEVTDQELKIHGFNAGYIQEMIFRRE